jgi:hypothetical protein
VAGVTRRDSGVLTELVPGAIYLRRAPSQRTIALNAAWGQSRVLWFALSAFAMASIAYSTLDYQARLPAMFNQGRYQFYPVQKSERLPSFSPYRGQEDVESDQSDEVGAPFFAKPVRTIRFVKSSTEEEEASLLAPRAFPLGLANVGADAKIDDLDIFTDLSTKQAIAGLGKFGQYLWEVYQRAPTKRDRSGDFTWKDPESAIRFGMSVPKYVIGGMDPNFRERLYHAGRAMDEAGIKWAILSAFRDDYRQRIASGYKASSRNSLHGGSARTGGYGHGRAVDVTSEDADTEAVWKWIDTYGAEFGLHRPMPGIDPGHVQLLSDLRKPATALRQAHIKRATINKRANVPAAKNKLLASAS